MCIRDRCTVEKSCIGYTKIVAASLDTDMKGMTICGIPIVANHDGIVAVSYTHPDVYKRQAIYYGKESALGVHKSVYTTNIENLGFDEIGRAHV